MKRIVLSLAILAGLAFGAASAEARPWGPRGYYYGGGAPYRAYYGGGAYYGGAPYRAYYARPYYAPAPVYRSRVYTPYVAPYVAAPYPAAGFNYYSPGFSFSVGGF